ncbi:MAG: hypothetical protein LBV61_06505 [Burkholderiaceae bacterium]|jgi:hypothetical protein|nr:hypothetical protein [Burkholderiaceae bacterium]
MIRLALRCIPLLAVLAVAGCANVQLDATSPTPATVEKLRMANLSPAQAGAFKLAPGKNSAMDTTLGGLRGSTLAPAKGRWSQFLKDTLVTELTAAGLYDSVSRFVIEGQLTDSKVDAAIGTGTARLAARFIVTDRGKVVFDKKLAANASWESSFYGAAAIPAAMNQYGALYKKLVSNLIDDPDFRRALAK